jgi:hypothetical protein
MRSLTLSSKAAIQKGSVSVGSLFLFFMKQCRPKKLDLQGLFREELAIRVPEGADEFGFFMRPELLLIAGANLYRCSG